MIRDYIDTFTTTESFKKEEASLFAMAKDSGIDYEHYADDDEIVSDEFKADYEEVEQLMIADVFFLKSIEEAENFKLEKGDIRSLVDSILIQLRLLCPMIGIEVPEVEEDDN